MTSQQLSIADALAIAALSLVLFFVLAPALTGYGAPGLAAAQVASFAVPALWFSRLRTGNFEALGLRHFRPKVLLGLTLIAASMWIWNVHWVTPIGAEWASSEQRAELESFFALPSRPLWQSLFFFSVVPAICEELLHRGVLLPALCRGLGRPMGLLLSAILFGLSHFSLARLLPTAALGLVSGGIRLRSRSLWPCMLLHAGYNACLLTSASRNWGPPASWAWIGALATVVGAFLLHRYTESQPVLVS